MLCRFRGSGSGAADCGTGCEYRGRIEGTLVNEVSGLALRRGSVTLRLLGGQGGSPKTAITDAEGRFAIEEIESGLYELTGRSPGFAPGTYTCDGSKVMAIQAGMNIHGLRLALAPLGVIAGRVVDEMGEPMTEVQVSFLRYGRSAGRPALRGSGPPIRVDDRGMFRAASLLPGTYTVVATVTGAGSGEPAVDYIPTYYPNAATISEAIPISITPSSEMSVTIALRRERVFRVSGRVVVERAVPNAGEWAQGQRMLLSMVPENLSGSPEPPFRPSAIVTPEGRFRFERVPAGVYTIETPGMLVFQHGVGRITPPFYCRQQVVVTDRNLEEIVIPAYPGVSVRGEIHGPDEREDARRAQVERRPVVILEAADGAGVRCEWKRKTTEASRLRMCRRAGT
ncbi:MAG: collagen binding domain-containing protein [Bryobacteraceae bacterium]